MKILYYLPVKSKHIKKWEFYKPDLDALKKHAKVKTANSFIEFILNFLSVDIIYCMWWHRSSIPIIISKVFKKKVVCSGAIHFEDLSGEKTWFNSSVIYRLLNLISLKITDYNIVVSKQQEIYFKKYLGIKNCFLLKLKINKSLNNKLKKKFTKKNQKKKKLILTTILWHTKSSYNRKGLFQTIDALSLLKKKGINFKFNIVGQAGDGLNLLSKKINLHDLNSEIKIFLNLGQSKKVELLKKTHLYLQPSFCEAFSYAVLEASALGVMSLVGYNTAQREIILNYGYCIRKINKKQIYNAIINYFYLKNEKEKSSLKKLKNHLTRNYSFNKHVYEMKTLLNRLNFKR